MPIALFVCVDVCNSANSALKLENEQITEKVKEKAPKQDLEINESAISPTKSTQKFFRGFFFYSWTIRGFLLFSAKTRFPPISAAISLHYLSDVDVSICFPYHIIGFTFGYVYDFWNQI